MKKEDALNKWCPFVQVSSAGNYINNNRLEFDNEVGTNIGCNCITSGCMAWIENSSDNFKGGYCARLEK